MKKKKYSATYKGKTYCIYAFCEEEVWYNVLLKHGIKFTPENAYDLAKKENMEIVLT